MSHHITKEQSTSKKEVNMSHPHLSSQINHGDKISSQRHVEKDKRHVTKDKIKNNQKTLANK